MPQLDKVTFFSQFFWLCFFYLGFYGVVVKQILPRFGRIFKLRENKNEISKVLKLSGIGKFPFITSSVEKIDFESLTVGKTD